MIARPTSIPDVLLLRPKVFSDERGFFLESYNKRVLAELTGWSGEFVQDNVSRSVRGVLRGLHYQIQQPQGKLIRVSRGSVYDVAVDLRRSSPTFGQWAAVVLGDETQDQLWIPPGFAHGFQVLSEVADVHYKTTDFYAAAAERCVTLDDPDLAIPWPLPAPLLSAKDKIGKRMADAETYP